MAPADSERPRLSVEVVHSPRAGVVESVALRMAIGASVADAVRASGFADQHPDVPALPCGVWGKVASPDAALRDGDRVELYRPLRVDPKEARRQRYRAHQAKFKPAR